MVRASTVVTCTYIANLLMSLCHSVLPFTIMVMTHAPTGEVRVIHGSMLFSPIETGRMLCHGLV